MGGDHSSTTPALPITVVGHQWKVAGQKLGSGSFGDVYLGVNIDTNHRVAIKVEPGDRRNPHLQYEAKLMQELSGGVGVPTVYHYGTEKVSVPPSNAAGGANGGRCGGSSTTETTTATYNVMVLDLLGPSLEELFTDSGHKFTLKTTLQLVEMMLCRIEFIHSRFIIHRDIKPHNFLMGQPSLAVSCSTPSTTTTSTSSHTSGGGGGGGGYHAGIGRLLYIIDFGLAKKYRNPKTLDHIPYKEDKTLTGTARYVSINTHNGIEQSRRDDLESLGYVFVYFLKGALPWQNLKAPTKKDKYTKIKEVKEKCRVEDLCLGLPREFADFLKYTKYLRFTERPDYAFCRRMFRDLTLKRQYPNDFLYDWTRKTSCYTKSNNNDSRGAPPPLMAANAATPNNYTTTNNMIIQPPAAVINCFKQRPTALKEEDDAIRCCKGKPSDYLLNNPIVSKRRPPLRKEENLFNSD